MNSLLRARSLVVLSAMLGLAFAVTCPAGCVLVTAAISTPVPGYGRGYQILDADNAPTQSGLLLMKSTYHSADQMVRAFDIRNGSCELPKQTELRFSGQWPLGAPFYYGGFENPRCTYIFPLVPGRVAEGRYDYYSEEPVSAPGSARALACGIIRVLPATPAQEAEMLRRVAEDMSAEPSGQSVDDYEGRQRVLRYIEVRFKMLGLTEKVPGLPGPPLPGE